MEMRTSDTHKKSLGRVGEGIACAFLQSGGMSVIGRNYRSGHREIDIICVDGNALRFVEVKTRQEPVEGNPAEAVNRNKQRNLVAAAHAYLRSDDFKECAVRYDEIFFDVVTIVWNAEGTQYELEYIPDAFRPMYV